MAKPKVYRKKSGTNGQRTVERGAEYYAYIKSPAWKAVRERYWASKMSKICVCCSDARQPLDLHHRTYKNLGCERLMDLVPICRRCHDEVHVELRKRPGMQLWNAHTAIRKRHKDERHIRDADKFAARAARRAGKTAQKIRHSKLARERIERLRKIDPNYCVKKKNQKPVTIENVGSVF